MRSPSHFRAGSSLRNAVSSAGVGSRAAALPGPSDPDRAVRPGERSSRGGILAGATGSGQAKERTVCCAIRS